MGEAITVIIAACAMLAAIVESIWAPSVLTPHEEEPTLTRQTFTRRSR